VPDSSERLLSYNRIDANRRRTRVLLVAFAAMLLPVVSGATWIMMPMVVLFGSDLIVRIWGPEALYAIIGPPPQPTETSGPLELSDLPASALMLQGGILALALVTVLLGLVAVTIFLIARYGSSAVLRMARARPVQQDREPELVRAVENLCIGAGLPQPAIHVVESAAPNAFAIGRDPEHASLVVTRGLLTLLDRRELEGVIAHELSHIGNQDIRLSTTLAALVTTLCLPIRFVTAPFRFAFRLGWQLKVVALVFLIPVSQMVISGYLFSFELFADETTWQRAPSILWWLELHAMLSHFHIFYVAPLMALVIRHAVSRQREYLADADAALLTRDPEGLALALVKVATARGVRMRVGEGTVHLYFADPRQERALFRWLFPSHPPIEERIELLAQMGSGITPADLQRAREAGARAEAERLEFERLQNLEKAEHGLSETSASAETPSAISQEESPLSGSESADAAGNTTDNSGIPLYEKPDGWSRVVRRLAPDAVLSVAEGHGEFIRVVTTDDVTGYVSINAGLRVLNEPGKKGIA
jgi:heat shock protein HtpX